MTVPSQSRPSRSQPLSVESEITLRTALFFIAKDLIIFLVLAVAAFYAFREARLTYELDNAGKIVQANVVHKDAVGCGCEDGTISYYLTYQYTVLDGDAPTLYAATENVSQEAFDQTELGKPITVVYAPSAPHFSKAAILRAVYDSRYVILGCAMTLGFAFMGLVVILNLRRMSRQYSNPC